MISTLDETEISHRSSAGRTSPGKGPGTLPWLQSLLVRWHQSSSEGGVDSPHCWRHHLQTQLGQQQLPSHGLTANGPPGPSEEETQADECPDGFSSSGHQVPRFGPLHPGEENGNHPQSLPHGAGSKERIQGGEWAQVGHHWFRLWVSFVNSSFETQEPCASSHVGMRWWNQGADLSPLGEVRWVVTE